MPAPSKFTRARAATVVEILVASGSRREAARRIGVDHETIARWVRRGDRQQGSGTRFDTFARTVHLAETPTEKPILVPLKPARTPRAEVEEVWRFLEEHEPGYARRPEPEPIKVVVAFAKNVVEEGDPA